MLVLAALVLLVTSVMRPGSLSAQAAATAPGNLQATVVAGGVQLSWSAPTGNAGSVTGYQVLRGRDGQSSLISYVNDTGSTDTSYIDWGAAQQGQTYTYQVKAKRGYTASAASNSVAVTIPGACPISGASPVDVPVSQVPIVVASTAADYFVLYVVHGAAGETVELPVLVKLGEAGTTTLADNLDPLPAAKYRVEKYRVANPSYIDGDCIDDLTELADPGSKNPVNKAETIDLSKGAVTIPDRATFEKLSYRGDAVGLDVHLNDVEFVKFIIFDASSNSPAIYFMNTGIYNAHYFFQKAIHRGLGDRLTGEIAYHPNVVAPDGSPGVYHFEITYSFKRVALAYEVLAASMPLLENNLAYYPVSGGESYYNREKALYDASRVNVLLEEDIFPDVDFMPFNEGEGYGLLREMELEERPNPRDIVIYETLPNDLPRVAGIITGVPQTPLSHVNLRAVQNGVPNAFIRDPLDDATIDDLLDRHVYYKVTQSGYTLRAATRAEVDAHYDASRSASAQTPERDLSVTKITPLSEIGFDDWDAFGVKAANMAVLGTLGFPEGAVRDGFAVPFYFYDEFMKNAGLAEETVFGKGKGAAEDRFTLPAGTKLSAVVTAILAHPKFRTDYEIQDEMLDDLRDAIKDARSPAWIITALEAMHAKFPEGTSLRYRSSTNNEDLPGYNGAGLYSSKTQDPDETAEEGIDKSIKGVWASLWNFRAFAERDFHRIDHAKTAMGVLVHPNYTLEKANGVAVSFDPVTNRAGAYYVNTQLGEDLITNPEAHSRPEEILLLPGGSQEVLVRSNLAEPGKLLMSAAQLTQLRSHLEVIHKKFSALYGAAEGEPFAMDIEFKITSLGKLSIKQARPWVFEPHLNRPPTVASTIVDVTIVNESGTREISLSGVFADDDGDSLTVTATSSNENVATVSVSADYATLTVAAQARGTATITVAAAAGNGGSVEDSFTVKVKAAPVVASAIEDVTGLEVGSTQDISLSGVFSDADGDALTVTATSSDENVVTVSVSADQSKLAVSGVAEGAVPITVTARDADGNSVGDAFEVSVSGAEPPEGSEPWDIRVMPGDGTLTVTWNVSSRDGVDDSDIWHVLRWSQESGVWANPHDPRAVSRSDGFSVDPGLTGYTITDLKNGVATGVFIRSMVGHRNNMSERDGNSSKWVRVKGKHTTPVAPPNAAPTVANAIADATIVSESGTKVVSLAGVFSDADGDELTITATSSDDAVATVSVSADYSTLTVTAQSRGTATITVNASDGNGGTVDDSFAVTVKAAPGLASAIADISGLEAGDSRAVSLSGVFRDADGDSMTITASSSDEGKATVSVASDQSALTVSGVAKGTATVTVTAQDSDGNRVSDSFTVTVSAPANNPPTVASAISDATIVNTSGSHQVALSGVFSDADGDDLTVKATSSAEGVATVAVAADYSTVTVTAKSRGKATVTVTATDGNGGSVEDSFAVTVKAAPVVASAIPDATMVEVSSKELDLSTVFSDDDGDTLTYTVSSTDLDAVAVFEFLGTMTVLAIKKGTETITVTAQDSDGNQVSDSFTVTVTVRANNPPTVASAIADATILNESGTHRVTLSGVFSDADGDDLTFKAASSAESVATVAVSNSSLTVTAKSRGTAVVTVTASDGNGGSVEDSFTVKIKSAPRVASPISDISGLEAEDSRAISLSGVFSDPDGDTVTVTEAASSDSAIAVVTAAIDGLTSAITAITVTGVADGTATITVTAQDTDGNTVSDAFDVTVNAPAAQQQVNNAPTVSAAIADATIVNETGTHGVTLSGVFSDADGDDLTATAASTAESVATVAVSSDYSTLTVSAKSRGTATVTVTAADGYGGTVEDAFTVTVKAAPVVAAAIEDVSELEMDATHEVTLPDDAPLLEVFSDADGDALTITAESSDTEVLEVATVVAESTQTVTGLAVTGVAVGTATVTVTAEDTDGNTVSDEFDVTVVEDTGSQFYDGEPVPSPVTDLQLTAEGASLIVSWSAPGPDTGGEVRGYIVHLSPEGGGKGRTKTPKAKKTKVSFENLEAGRTYKVWVRAENEAGKGERVRASITLPEAEPPLDQEEEGDGQQQDG